MITIEISEEDKRYAHKSTEKLLESVKNTNLKNRFSTNEYENKFLGYLGERLFSKWLEQENIKHTWQNDCFGTADEYDFLINNKKIDVKTAKRIRPLEELQMGRNFNFNLMVCESQTVLKADYYFWMFVLGLNPKVSRLAVLIGFMSADRVKEYEVVEKVVPGHWINFRDVIPPEHFKTIMEEE